MFDDGTVTKVGLGKYYIDGSVILPYDIYGGAINEGTKGNIFKYRVTDFYDKERKVTLAYSAHTIKKNGYLWIDIPDNEILMHDVFVEMVKEGHKQYINAMGRIKGKKYKDEAAANTVLLYVQQR